MAIFLGVVAALLLIAAALLARFFLRAFGRWLVVADALQPAQSILVLGGYLPFRAMEAARFYNQRLAPEVWLTQYPPKPEELVLASMGIEWIAENAFSRRVLEHLGVPAEAISIVAPPALDTMGELRAAALTLRRRGGSGRIIIVTSKSHARRVKVLWRAIAGSSFEAIVRYTEQDPFAPDRWFLNTRDLQAVAHEFFGLLNAWAGFPIRAQRS